MSFIHPFSEEATSSELDVFAIPTTNTAVDSERFTAYKPVASLASSDWIEFIVPGTNEFIDPATIYIELDVEIVKSDGTALPNAAAPAAAQGQAAHEANLFEKIIPCNNFMSSLFQQLDVRLNNTLVTSSTNMYAYRAYLDCLFYQSKHAKQTYMYTHMWEPDKSKRKERIKRCYSGKRLRLCGPLHFDLGQQERLILNQIDMAFRLNLSDSSFCLVVEDGTAHRPRVKIVDATLHVEHKKLFADCEAGIMVALANDTAKYFFTHTQMRRYVIDRNSSSYFFDNIFPSILPRRFVIGLISSKCFDGDWNTDPFEFKHHDLSEIRISRDGVQVPSPAILQDVEDDDYARSFFCLYQNFGALHPNTQLSITADDFKTNCALYCWNLATQKTLDNGDTVALQERGHIRAEFRFKKPTQDTLIAIVYANFGQSMEISADRTVHMSEI